MSLGEALYQLFIYPLQLIYELIFYYAVSFAGSIGVAIILLSLAMNFMLLPLYRQADRIQDEERDAQKKMDHWLRHIKATFKGNERFMMTQTYYRQNNYKPYYALRGMMPLLLEIPFFIAAYNYLSDLYALNVSFGPIRNLSTPDGMIQLFGISINALPIIMTIINIISGAIYTKGLKFKDKLQLYGMALIFLVLLYNSPSGLVLYWTMNNLFSLVKNIIIRLKDPSLAGAVSVSIIGALAAVWGLVMPKESFSECMPMMDIALACLIPLLILLLKRHSSIKLPKLGEPAPKPLLFFSGCLFMALLTGLLIPSDVIVSSPMEFVTVTDYRNPLENVLASFLLAVGVFLVWLGILYYLSGKRVRSVLDVLIWILSGGAIINYMVFSKEPGSLTSELMYSYDPYYNDIERLINIGVLVAAALILWLLWKKAGKAVGVIYAAFCLATVGMAGMNIVNIQSAVPEIERVISASIFSSDQGLDKLIKLSKNKKNVIVFMLDRAMSPYLPYLFQEKPELKKQFDGFTYYPDTLSYGSATIYGSPAIYGGYDYTPSEINARKDQTLFDKHNEALLMMPRLFSENGYDVTVIDPPFAGYSWIPDLSIYKGYPEIKAYNIEEGQMVTDGYSENTSSNGSLWKRNIFFYGLMRTSPYLMRNLIYKNGTYYYPENLSFIKETISLQFGIHNQTLYSFAALDRLDEITDIDDTENNSLLLITNNITHSDGVILQEPEYVPKKYVNNEEYDNTHKDRFMYDGVPMRVEDIKQMAHYHVNMAALLRLGEWFDYLRENDAYDNTRIIIVSDHGFSLGQFDTLKMFDGSEITRYNPLLLVKDFGSKGFKTDLTFMTNADVPTIATDRLIEAPVNPFTGNPINSSKKVGTQYVINPHVWEPEKNGKYQFAPTDWYTVHDNILIPDNWKYEGFH